jgi:NADH-quinone oxidoreductase subunit A
MIEYSDFVRQYLTVAIFAGVGIGLGAGLLGIGKIFRPTRPQEQKYLVYESGVDVEAVFIFPWATRLEIYGVFGLVEMLIFVVILALGLLYAWRKKVLQWA